MNLAGAILVLLVFRLLNGIVSELTVSPVHAGGVILRGTDVSAKAAELQASRVGNAIARQSFVVMRI
ncbi:hypothetical protein WK68_14835 [Burkholderia ubonensis]|nr:hypothetical protein WK68_14835 [Burkholderia ubonensis]